MIYRIEKGEYHYRGDDVCDISATLNIYEDDGTTVISSTGLSASYNIAQEDYVVEIQRQITEQVNAYLAKLSDLDAKRLSRMPESTSFSHAVELILAPIQTAIGG